MSAPEFITQRIDFTFWMLKLSPKIRIKSKERNRFAILIFSPDLMITNINQIKKSPVYVVLREKLRQHLYFQVFRVLENILIELCTIATFYYIFLVPCKTSKQIESSYSRDFFCTKPFGLSQKCRKIENHQEHLKFQRNLLYRYRN